MRQDAANAPRTYAKSRTGSSSERYSYELERPEEFLTLTAEELLTCPPHHRYAKGEAGA